MKLFIVSCDEYDYDEYNSFVIAANDEDEAVTIAKDRAYNFTVNKVQVELISEVSIYNHSMIIHESFNAG